MWTAIYYLYLVCVVGLYRLLRYHSAVYKYGNMHQGLELTVDRMALLRFTMAQKFLRPQLRCSWRHLNDGSLIYFTLLLGLPSYELGCVYFNADLHQHFISLARMMNLSLVIRKSCSLLIIECLKLTSWMWIPDLQTYKIRLVRGCPTRYFERPE